MNQDSLILKDFTRRVADYVKLHRTVQSQIHRLKPTNSPVAIERYAAGNSPVIRSPGQSDFRGGAAWKICYFHHPLYSYARAHGADAYLRKLLEPVFQAHGVNVVFSGHEHVYERLKPQNGIYYFVLGNSGQLCFHDLRPSPDTAKGFDIDRTFEVVEIAGNQLYFQVVSRTGDTVVSGTWRSGNR